MKYQEDQKTQTQLTQFREKVTEARRRAGRQQQELAEILGLDAHVLSRKLHGRSGAQLVHREVKQIIQTLSAWEAITTREEAIELLNFMNLKEESFTPQEWEAASLKRLAAASPLVVAGATIPWSSWPIPLTTYIPRQELEECIVDRLRQPGVRLLTLLGTGGVGKTRLSLAVLPALEREFPAGIFFVSLDGLQDAALVPDAIAEALDLTGPDRADGPSTMERLKLFLRSGCRLLVLDNFEHLLEARTLVSELLSAGPHVKILVTSRRVLDIYGEHLLHITPLDIVDPDDMQDPIELKQNAAIRLFMEGASINSINTFVLDKQNMRIIAHICLYLDGLPLAIELAAARCRLITPQMLLDQLRNQNSLLQKEEDKLTARSLWRQEFHGIAERQRTMQRTFDWSYDLLSASSQHIFTQLSVFVGSWSLEAVQCVCDQQKEALRTALEELVNQSLLLLLPVEKKAAHEEPGSRFVFLRIIREYALARCIEHAEYETVRKRHMLYYLSLAERIEPQLWSGKRSEAMRQLAREQENLRAALHCAIEHKDGTIAQRFCGVLGIYWEAHNQFTEGRRWLDAALSLSQDSTPLAVRATCLLMASRLTNWEMSYQRSRDYAEQALAFYEQARNNSGRGRALFQLGDAWHMEGEHRTAERYFEACLLLQHEPGQQRDYAFTLGRLGAISMLNGDIAHVEIRLREAIAIFRSCGERSGLGILLNYLGMLFLLQGKPTEALPSLRESLEIAQTEGYRYNLALTLVIFGCVLGHIAGPEATAHLCGAAEMLFQQIGSAFPRGYQAIYRWYLAGIQTQADTEDWACWWQEGGQLSMQQAASLAYQKSDPHL